MSFLRNLSIGLILSITASGPAAAQLIFTVDTAAKKFYFSGSDTGNPGFDGVGGRLTWESSPSSGSQTSFAIQSALTSSGAVGLADLKISDNGQVLIDLDLNSTATLTITPTPSVRFDYTSLPANQLNLLESFAITGTPINLTLGTGFSDFQVAAVPEPRFVGVLAIVGILSLVLVRRRPRSFAVR